MPIGFIELFLICGATWRMTRLIALDHFPPTAWIRREIEERWEGSTLDFLASCMWCSSFWWGLLFAGWWYASLDGPVEVGVSWWIVTLALTASLVTGQGAVREPE